MELKKISKSEFQIQKRRDPGSKSGMTGSFTLIEVLMAASIFTAIGLMAITIFININNLQLRSNMENAMYEDARFMMERISREVRNNAIDYEEYFNKDFQKNGASCKQYGDDFGLYAAQFYNPGAMKENETPGTATPAPGGDYGAFCNDGTPYTGQQNCVVYKPSLDINTGVYGADPQTGPTGNAFAPDTSKFPDAIVGSGVQTELYLISPDGKQKTIFALKHTNPTENVLAVLKLDGEDSNNDGITEKWRKCTVNNVAQNYCCASGFNCELAGIGKLEDTLAVGGSVGLYDGFVPVSPVRTTISDLHFLVFPQDDPNKGFDESVNIEQPAIFISMTVKPSASELSKFPSAAAVPTITLETLVSSRIQSDVKSYLGYGTKNIGAGLGTGDFSNNWACP